MPTISMNTFRNNAEKSTKRTKNVHAEKIGYCTRAETNPRKELPFMDKMKLGFDNSVLHKGKKCCLRRKRLILPITTG